MSELNRSRCKLPGDVTLLGLSTCLNLHTQKVQDHCDESRSPIRLHISHTLTRRKVTLPIHSILL